MRRTRTRARPALPAGVARLTCPPRSPARHAHARGPHALGPHALARLGRRGTTWPSPPPEGWMSWARRAGRPAASAPARGSRSCDPRLHGPPRATRASAPSLLRGAPRVPDPSSSSRGRSLRVHTLAAEASSSAGPRPRPTGAARAPTTMIPPPSRLRAARAHPHASCERPRRRRRRRARALPRPGLHRRRLVRATFKCCRFDSRTSSKDCRSRRLPNKQSSEFTTLLLHSRCFLPSTRRRSLRIGEKKEWSRWMCPT